MSESLASRSRLCNLDLIIQSGWDLDSEPNPDTMEIEDDIMEAFLVDVESHAELESSQPHSLALLHQCQAMQSLKQGCHTKTDSKRHSVVHTHLE